MTSLTINTPASNMNTVMSINSAASFESKLNRNNYFSYITTSSKNAVKKTTSRIVRIDWDLNMNELEFE